ncbi:MAG: hypothetical protein R2838_06310 [Caldilineaceae bacterium]
MVLIIGGGTPGAARSAHCADAGPATTVFSVTGEPAVQTALDATAVARAPTARGPGHRAWAAAASASTRPCRCCCSPTQATRWTISRWSGSGRPLNLPPSPSSPSPPPPAPAPR